MSDHAEKRPSCDGTGVGETPNPMTPAEFAEAMQDVVRNHPGDPEAQHGRADGLMCELLAALGYSYGVAVFAGMRKWYA